MTFPEMTGAAHRYCFVLPDLPRPMGGQTVLYDMATMLRAAGHETVIIHGGRFHRYHFAETDCEICHLPDLASANPARGVRNKIKRARQRLAERRANPPIPLFRSTPRDVMVIPEFNYPVYADMFPHAPLVMVVQDPTALLKAYSGDAAARSDRYVSVLATSAAAARGVEIVLGRTPHRMILPVARPGLQPDCPKKLQIAYMPRKLRTQAERVARTLKRRPALADVPIVVIENMTNDERDRVLNESLVFLAFSNMEGFGLPPAEAMAAGCLVIGYTGVGANEFFTEETGFVVEQNDTPEIVAKVEEVITAYRRDPAALDRLRAGAARCIADRYTRDKARDSLLDAWTAVAADVRSCEHSAST